MYVISGPSVESKLEGHRSGEKASVTLPLLAYLREIRKAMASF